MLFRRKTDDRCVASRDHLEFTINDAVKSECDGFAGVIVQRVKPRSGEDFNWAIKGVRFGKADRGQASRVLETVVERLQQEFILAEVKKSERRTLKLPIAAHIEIPPDGDH